ncbi:MAG: 2-dehydropantoate 2-reductase [Alphaproteobacteria bacterium]|nr:2-dehydropantoate 2-reductase [Alphaproteobacteria bacterium]
MRICIYGAGAVGGNFAARLARAGIDVTVVARGRHLEAIQARGLTVQAGEERIHVRPFATDDPRRAGPQDAVIVALKAPALPGAVAPMAPLLGPDTPVVFATNGVPWWYFHRHPGPLAERRLPRLDPEGVLWERLPVERAIGGVVYSANEIVAPGVVSNNSPTRNRLVVGEPDGSVSARIQKVSEALKSGGIDSPVNTDIRAEVWTKLMGNLAWNPMCAVTGLGIRMMATDPALLALARRVLEEGQRVAEALGVTVNEDVDTRMKRAERPGPGAGHKPSMLQDFELKRPTELDAIVLAVQDFAREVKVPTPALDAVAALAVGRARALGIYP